MSKFTDRLRKGWNAFVKNKDPSYAWEHTPGSFISTDRPDRMYFKPGIDRTIISAIYNRIAVDAAAVDIRHIRTDENGRYVEEIDSDLNEALKVEANIDQTGRAMVQDAVQSLCDEGCVAIVPVVMDSSPIGTDSYKIYELRVGKILEWYPYKIKVRVYNEDTGQKEDIFVLKKYTAIVENPLYTIMNGPNSTLQRLTRKLNLLDKLDGEQASGKLDLIIQLPYIVKTETRKQQAEERRKLVETQLANSKYGVAYIDGTEHIVQLNRSVENNLWAQAKDLLDQVYSQLGLTTDIMNGTANEEAMTNYYARTIEPILSAITEEMHRKFLTKTARTQGQAIKFFKDPFKLISTTNIAQIADTFTRNAIMSSNEVRAIIGMKPSEDNIADSLSNKNLNQPTDPNQPVDPNGNPVNIDPETGEIIPDDQNQNTEEPEEGEDVEDEEVESDLTQEDYDSAMNDLDDIDKMLDELEKEVDK